MEVVNLPSSNITLAAPPGMEDRVEPIQATRYILKDNDGKELIPGYMVAFRLDESEMKKLQETGGMIYFHVMGELFPPIMPTVYSMEDVFGKNAIYKEGE